MRTRIFFATLLLAAFPALAQSLSITTLAGSRTGGGFSDGAGDQARFSAPRAIATDLAGNLLVADTGNHTIRKVSPAGVVTTIAGRAGQAGFADGTGDGALFRFPAGIAVDPFSGTIYVSDKDNHVIRRVTPEGVVTTIAGEPGVLGSADEIGTAAKFAFPRGLVVGPDGDIYVADTQNHAIRKVTAAGIVTTFAGSIRFEGSNDGPALQSRFSRPSDIAFNGNTGVFYVSDTGNHRIRTIANGTVSTLAGSTAGYQDGTGAQARLNGPWGLEVAGDGIIYVADHDNFMVRAITPQGTVSTLAGSLFDGKPSSGANDGVGSEARFNFPSGVAVSFDAHTVFISDAFNHAIRAITTPIGNTSTLAGSKPERGFVSRTGSNARLHFPTGVASDAEGNVYVAQTNSIAKITPSGATSIFAGRPGEMGWADGPGANALFTNPTGVAVGPDGNIYVADFGNNTIRKISPSGFVTTLAGNGFNAGYTDGSSVASRFARPWGIVVDSQNIVYVTELDNSTIRRIEPDGTVSTLAGQPAPGFFDATGSAARFNFPSGITVDAARNLYVADWGNNVIRKITQAGVVTTIAGIGPNASGTRDGIGREAMFFNPSGVVSDAGGNLYVSEYSHVIRRVTTNGVVSTVAGLAGSPGNIAGIGDDARFAFPEHLALLPNGKLVIADSLNHAVRLGTLAPSVRRRLVRH